MLAARRRVINSVDVGKWRGSWMLVASLQLAAVVVRVDVCGRRAHAACLGRAVHGNGMEMKHDGLNTAAAIAGLGTRARGLAIETE